MLTKSNKLVLLIAISAIVLAEGLYAENPEETNSNLIAIVGTKKITYVDLYARLKKLYGKETISDMVEEAILIESAKEANINVENEIEAKLEIVKSKFKDEKSYNEFIKSRKINLIETRRRIRLDILREKLVKKSETIKVTKKEVRRFFEENKLKYGESAELNSEISKEIKEKLISEKIKKIYPKWLEKARKRMVKINVNKK